MKKGSAFLILMLGLALESTASWADDPTQVCLSMVQDASRDVGVTTNSSAFLDTVFDNYCNTNGTTKDSGFHIGLSAIIQSIPIGLTGGSTDTTTQVSNFCRNYQSTRSANASSSSYQSKVVQSALQSANQCLEIATKTQATATYRVMTPSMLAINISVPAGQTINVRGLNHDTNVSCVGSSVKRGGIVRYSAGVGQVLDANVGTYSITCRRQPTSTQNGTAFYDASALVLDTNAAPLNIYWPKDSLFPPNTASEIEGDVSKVSLQVTNLKSQVDFNLLPIGTILPWFQKNGTPPPGWVACDGSHTESCPNLSGLFLRGGTAADIDKTPHGSDTADVYIGGSNNKRGDGNGFNAGGSNYSWDDTIQTVPRYMTVVYIMKVANQ